MVDFIAKSEQADRCLVAWIIILFVGVLGAVKPVLFNGGSPMAKYIAKQDQLAMVEEEKVEDYFESVVFSKGNTPIDDLAAVEESERMEIIERVFAADRGIAWIILFSPLLLLIPKLRNESPVYHILLLVSLWLFLIAVGAMLNGGKKFSEVAILAHATRWGLPLFLWYLIFSRRHEEVNVSAKRNSLWILMVCSSLTFAVHGVEAWLLNPPFQDLIYNFGTIWGVELSPRAIHILLRIIGTMDLVFAVLVLWKRRRVVYLRMALWGFITALSRPVTLGMEAWPEFAMRIANGGLPFILFYIYHASKQDAQEDEPNKKTEELTYENA